MRAVPWMKKNKALLSATVLGTALLTLLILNLALPEKQIRHSLSHEFGVSDPQFRRELGTLLGPPILGGNATVNLENGQEIFPAMLDAIRSATKSITFETYIYWSGDIGRQFAESLAERARAGVAVHVLLDWAGSQKVDDTLLQELRDAGVEVEMFHPLHWYHLSRMNNRTHRKLLVVDGKLGLTGGVGIADQWNGNAEDPDHWRDSHYRLTGPAVAQLQSAFMDNWVKITGKVLQGEAYFPALPSTGDVPAQVFTSSPRGGADSMMLMYLMALTSSERTVDLSAAYFVPDELTLQALIDARRRGVRVRIIVPNEHIDSQIVRMASRSKWEPLLEAGVEIHEFQPTMFHCKMLVVDNLLVSVGSTNFDNRSFRLNDEANLNIYDPAFAASVTRVFENDLQRAERITLEAWRDRPWHQRVTDRAAAVLSSQL